MEGSHGYDKAQWWDWLEERFKQARYAHGGTRTAASSASSSAVAPPPWNPPAQEWTCARDGAAEATGAAGRTRKRSRSESTLPEDHQPQRHKVRIISKTATDFRVKATTPLERVFDRWCLEHDIPRREAQFRREGCVVDGAASLAAYGWLPCACCGCFVLQAVPLHECGQEPRLEDADVVPPTIAYEDPRLEGVVPPTIAHGQEIHEGVVPATTTTTTTNPKEVVV